MGNALQVEALREILGLTHKAKLDTVEPAYSLDLANLIVPQTDLTLHPLEKVPTETLIQWRAAYNVETLEGSVDDAVESATRDIARYIETGHYRSLWDGNTPVAMTGFNAALLAEAAKTGVTRSVLFAANEAAERAYRAIGFVPNGQFAIVFYDAPQVINV